MLRNLRKESGIQNFSCVQLSFPMNFLSTKFYLIIRSSECVVVHLTFFLFTSKPGNVTNSTSFANVLQKFAQIFEDSEQIFYATDLYSFDLYFHMKK